MRILSTRDTPLPDVIRLLTPSESDLRQQEEIVRGILQRVRSEGDAAVRELSARFDGGEYPGHPVPERAFQEAESAVSGRYREAVEHSIRNLTAFHEKQIPRSWLDSFEDGTLMGQQVRPLDRVGLYAPGGEASYPSTVLMTAVPARVAGVPDVVLCSPARYLTPEVLVAARAAGVSRVYPIGGAHAIGAMAYGTESIPKVDKICGPGGTFVVLAKRLVFGEVGIESLPGPSEVLVLADEGAPADWIAADLIAQAEHGGADHAAPCVLATPSEALASAVSAAAEARLLELSRGDLAGQNLSAMGVILVTRDLLEACDFCNLMAPEHLQVMTRDPWALLPAIRHAGAIFLGDYSAVPLGDYLAGPSHVLPTQRTGRFSSPLSVDDFVKKSSLIYSSPASTAAMAADAALLADTEGLTAHAASIRARLGQ
ncbi:MAG TPA: histidinol dehydrogenase [Armatimonadota bacterium]|jgi:histidinol dehydrogenase